MSQSEDLQPDYLTYQNYQQSVRNGAHTLKAERAKAKFIIEKSQGKMTSLQNSLQSGSSSAVLPSASKLHAPVIRGTRPSLSHI